MPHSNASTMLAVLHLDLVGYSKLLQSDDVHIVRLIESEMASVRDILERSSGAIRSRAGDSYLATFPALRDAFAAALEIQARAVQDDTEPPLLFRIGIHIGDVFLNGEEVAGNAVNIAARLESVADPGGICISRAARDLAASSLKGQFVSCGEVTLKNISEPVEIFKRGVDGKVHATVKTHLEALAPKIAVRPKILVRPFTTLSDDPKTACFATGFTTDLISRLSRFRHLDVIGRASSFALDAQTVDNTAAGKVDARYVTGGQFQIMDNRLRATVMLADAESDRVLWAERFDRKLDDFFEVQTEIEELTTSAMAVSIDLAEREAARARDPSSLDAYSLVVNGRLEDVMDGATGKKATERAMKYYKRAAAYDPQYAAALSGIACTHALQWLGNWTEDREKSMEASTEFALRAIDADANDARSHFSLGFVSLYRREHERSLAAYEHAMRLNPSDVEIIAEYADALKHSGEPEKAIPLLERALRLNPLRPDWYLSNLAHAHLVLGDYGGAIGTVRRMRQPLTAQRTYVASLMLAGHEVEGRREAKKLRSLEPDFSAAEWCKVVPDKLAEHNNILREGLERAGL